MLMLKELKQKETEHYIFNYFPNSLAEKDIEIIAQNQEKCYAFITQLLKVKMDEKIKYFLCQTSEQVGQIYGDNEPCNGFNDMPDKIYAVYNEQVKCVGFHEDAHIISYQVHRPTSNAIREGLAMFFDSAWWGIANKMWTQYYFKHNCPHISELIINQNFHNYPDYITYPIMGAFTEFLIEFYGIDKYLQFYNNCENNENEVFESVFGINIEVMQQKFCDYISLLAYKDNTEKVISKILRSKKFL